ALNLAADGSFFKDFLRAFNEYKDGDLSKAERDFKLLLKTSNDGRNTALVNFMLGEIYNDTHSVGLAIEYYAKAAIADVKTSTKESLALIKLSELLFKQKELQSASSIIRKAYNDAIFYGAQQ